MTGFVDTATGLCGAGVGPPRGGWWGHTECSVPEVGKVILKSNGD